MKVISKVSRSPDNLITRIRKTCCLEQDVVESALLFHELLDSCCAAILHRAAQASVCELQKLLGSLTRVVLGSRNIDRLGCNDVID